MPIPVVTDHFAAQVVLKGKSGQPEDVYTNTFYFRNDEIGPSANAIADFIAADLQEFYATLPSGVATPLTVASAFAGAVVEPVAQVRVYDLGQPAPRYPTLREINLGTMASSTLPSEVAVCLSYVASENQPRKRGRIYLGPLANSSIVVANGRAQVADNWRISVLRSYQRLLDKNNHTVSLWSPTAAKMERVTGAWMDNAFDTQRRRGEKATQRFTVGSYLGMAGTPIPTT